MHLFHYALRNVLRTKGRSILIGIIVMIIAFSVCIGLCIRQSAANAKDTAISEMNITAQISPDREAAMEKSRTTENGSFDKSKLHDMMGESLSLKELKQYAKADSVKSFYYTMTANVDGSGNLSAYSTESDSTSSSESSPKGNTIDSGDFTIQGVSSDEAMTSFTDGSCKISDGKVFEEGSSNAECIISSELAKYNNLSVGDKIKVKSPDSSKEIYTIKIVGIYKNTQSSAEANSMQSGRGQSDPANTIYMSYPALNKLVGNSSTITTRINGTYVLGTYNAYQSFEKEVKEMGLSEEYTVSSPDLSAYERSAQPLENLAKIAGYFLLVILIIGAVVLIVLNIFTTRERKYEIGVLSAIGMKKSKIVKLFLSEILIVSLVAVIIGGSIGAVTSVPLTNTLLSSQVTSQQESREEKAQAFGRDVADSSNQEKAQSPDNGGMIKGGIGGNFITKVSSAVDIKLLLELLLISIALALLGGSVSMIAITRYEPLQILSNRD